MPMVFPNVPAAPGVPALPRLASAVPAVVQLLTADSGALFGGLSAPEWGLFLNGVPIVTAESVVSFEYKQGYSISNFQVEPNAFESYNKVQKPFDVRLRFSTGGTLADRQALIASAQAAVDSLELMDAVTPEVTYSSLNPVNLDYRRTNDRGVGLLVIDIFCEQVRVTASSQFTNAATPGTSNTSTDPSAPASFNDRFAASAPFANPQSPSASPQINGGTVQPIQAAPGQFDLSQALP